MLSESRDHSEWEESEWKISFTLIEFLSLFASKLNSLSCRWSLESGWSEKDSRDCAHNLNNKNISHKFMRHVNNNPLIYLTSFSFLLWSESLMPSRFYVSLSVRFHVGAVCSNILHSFSSQENLEDSNERGTDCLVKSHDISLTSQWFFFLITKSEA